MIVKVPMFKPFIPKNLNLNTALDSSNLNFGKYGKLYEDKLKKFIKNDNLLTFLNFNLAYYVLFSTLDLKPGDEILISPLACLESIQPYVSYGFNIKLVDVNPLTGLIEINDLKKKIKSETKLIVINHYLGNVANLLEIQNVILGSNIQIINDCIESFGSKIEDEYLGSQRLNSNFIFNTSAVRIPNTITGAFISFSNIELYERALTIRDNGINRGTFRKKNGEINPDSTIITPSYSAIMNEINSYIGYIQMDYVEEILNTQKKKALLFKKVLPNIIPDIKFIDNDYQGMPNYWVLGFHTKDIDSAKAKLAKLGIPSSQIHINTNTYDFLNDGKIYPGIDTFLNTFLAVPTGWWITEENIKSLIHIG